MTFVPFIPSVGIPNLAIPSVLWHMRDTMSPLENDNQVYGGNSSQISYIILMFILSLMIISVIGLVLNFDKMIK